MASDRYRRPSRAAALAICGLSVVPFLFAGCAMGKLGVIYVPQQNVQPIKDAGAVVVEVKVEDLQPDQPLWHSSLRVGNPAETVKSAAETELKTRAFKVGAGGALVTIQVVVFEARIEPDGMTGVTKTSRALLEMRVQVRQQAGKLLYSGDAGGEGRASGIYLYREGAPELQESLENAFNRLFADPAFTNALLATRQPPPSAKPVVSPVRISGAFATVSRR
jgi:hypothetical protein